MKKIRMRSILAISAILVLSACSFSKKTSEPPKSTPDLQVLMDQGAASEKEGMKLAAVRRYEEAAALYPTAKQPWLRLAQIQFDSANYGEAIVAAQQVISRDDGDKVARSILAVSGLRVSSKALADLAKNAAITGSVRDEAQVLASILRENLGEKVLVPVPGTPVNSPAKPKVAPANPAPASPAAPSPAAAGKGGVKPSGGSPFGVLMQP